jgi:hypothetical protein
MAEAVSLDDLVDVAPALRQLTRIAVVSTMLSVLRDHPGEQFTAKQLQNMTRERLDQFVAGCHIAF